MPSSHATSDFFSTPHGSLATGMTSHTAPSSLYRTTLDSTGVVEDTLQTRLQDTKRWLYDADLGLLMGRSLVDWGKLLVACLVYLVVLVVMSVSLLSVLWKYVNWNMPNMQGPDSLLQAPGLSYRPMPYTTTSIVRFYRGCFYSSCTPYLDHLEAYIQYYEKDHQVGDSFIDCTAIKERRTKDLDKACFFDITDLGDLCVKQLNYGLNDGQPCFLMKLNKVFDWVPEEYQNIGDVPDAIKDIWEPDDRFWVYVACEGEDPASKDLMGPVTVTPKGFHFKYFPFRNQQSYRSPLVTVQFLGPAPGTLIMVTCRAYARNIVHSREEQVGEVHLEFLVD